MLRSRALPSSLKSPPHFAHVPTMDFVKVKSEEMIHEQPAMILPQTFRLWSALCNLPLSLVSS